MTNKYILVIGASRGIGKELVLQLAKNKEHKVIAASRNTDALAVFCKPNNIDFYALDLESDTIDLQVKKIVEQYPRIDVLINNAGKLINKPFHLLTREDFLSTYSVNALAVMQTVQAVLPKMEENGGHIVNISTMGAFQGSVKFAGLTAYSTSKAVIANFTELFAEEYKETRIAMNCLCLGAAQTEMLEEAFPGYKAPISAAQMANYISDFALEANKYINGKIIPVSLSTP